MSQPSSIRLAEALDADGFHRLARRARADEFHDFLSPHPLPAHELVAELGEFPQQRASRLIDRIKKGDFDATEAEAEEWAKTPEGKLAMKGLGVSRFAPETGIRDDNHALLMGHIIGALFRLKAADAGVPTEVEPIRDTGGNYTNRIKVTRPSGAYIITVRPEPT